MVIHGTDGHTGATHDTFVGEACHMERDIFGDRGTVEVGDVDQRGHGDRAGTHAAIAADTHVDLEAYLFFGQWLEVDAVFNTDDERRFF